MFDSELPESVVFYAYAPIELGIELWVEFFRPLLVVMGLGYR
jgi:hypothetical protein